jgi:hypothetical protein
VLPFSTCSRGRMLKKAVFIVGGAALVTIAAAIPYFPRGTDLYVHVLWPWQVMRCLHAGALPVWLPDLNAAYGSPGIGLYSPLSPTICGVLGLILGTGGRGVRAALVLAAIVVAAIAPGSGRRTKLMTAGLVLFSPVMLTEFFGRFPVAQLLAVPIAWMVLETAAKGRWRWEREGLLFSVLWLMHAPTTMLVGMISVFAIVIGHVFDRLESGERNHPTAIMKHPAVQLGTAFMVAAGLTLWHWFPLIGMASDFPLRSALTEGEHHPLRNLIGVSGPHLPDINIAMGWAAIGLLAALLASGSWKTRRGVLAIIAVILSTWVSSPVWRYLAPLDWIQFPWRWMFPAVLLATPAIVEALPRQKRSNRIAALVAMLIPLVGMPPAQIVPDPALDVRTDAREAGARVAECFSGNPFLIDVMEHRPLWWEHMAETMALVGPARAVLVPSGGTAEIVEWSPLERRLVVDAPVPTTVIVRLLADRHWAASINGQSAEPTRWGAAVATTAPAGRSEINVSWRADPAAGIGFIVGLFLLGVIYKRFRRTRRSAPRP